MSYNIPCARIAYAVATAHCNKSHDSDDAPEKFGLFCKLHTWQPNSIDGKLEMDFDAAASTWMPWPPRRPAVTLSP